jgi:hypothetical protein
MEQGQVADKLGKALELEERRLAARADELTREAGRRGDEITSRFAAHGHGPGSGTIVAAVGDVEIERLRQLAQAACNIRRDLCKGVPELGSPEQLSRLRDKVHNMLDAQWRGLHIGIARLVGGVQHEGVVRRLVDARFGVDLESIKAWVAREIEIIKGERELGLDGGAHADEAGRLDLCFALMPFAPELVPIYTMAIRPAADAAGLRCERADDTAKPGVILEQIDHAIGLARVIVADLTGLNPNVMQEVGFARARGKPIVFITQGEFRDLPFDIRHYRAHRYRHDDSGLATLREWLGQSFAAVLGEPAPADAQAGDLQLPLAWVQGNIQPQLEAEGYEVVYPSRDRADQYRFQGWEDVLWRDERGRWRRVVTVDHAPLRRRRSQA